MHCSSFLSCLHAWQDLAAGTLSLGAASVTAYLLWSQIEDTRRSSREKDRAAHQVSKIKMIHAIASIRITIEQMKGYWETCLNDNTDEYLFEHCGAIIDWRRSDIVEFAIFIVGLGSREASACTKCIAVMQVMGSRISPDIQAIRKRRKTEAIENYVSLLRVQYFLNSVLEYCRDEKNSFSVFGGVSELWYIEAIERGLKTTNKIRLSAETTNDVEAEINHMIWRSGGNSQIGPTCFGSGLRR
jgi:hypothetical protein